MQSSWTIAGWIWVTAVLTNALIGAGWVLGDPGYGTLSILAFALFASALFSLPILLVLRAVIEHCQSARISGGWALFWAYATGIVCTVFVHCCLMFFILGDFLYTYNDLLMLNLFSGILGVSVQAHRLLKISAVEPE